MNIKIQGNSVRKGMVILYNNDIIQVTNTSTIRPGKGGAYNQIEGRNVRTNRKSSFRLRSSEDIVKAFVSIKPCLFLYKSDQSFVFIDTKLYEEIQVPCEVGTDSCAFLTEQTQVELCFVDDICIEIRMPKTVVVKICDASVALKNQTVKDSYKKAYTDSKVQILVPNFINAGDKVVIDAQTRKYVKKNR